MPKWKLPGWMQFSICVHERVNERVNLDHHLSVMLVAPGAGCKPVSAFCISLWFKGSSLTETRLGRQLYNKPASSLCRCSCCPVSGLQYDIAELIIGHGAYHCGDKDVYYTIKTEYVYTVTRFFHCQIIFVYGNYTKKYYLNIILQ